MLFWKLLDHSYVQSSFSTITWYIDNNILEDTLHTKVSRTWLKMSKIDAKIDDGACKIIDGTKIQACTSKNIVPK